MTLVIRNSTYPDAMSHLRHLALIDSTRHFYTMNTSFKEYYKKRPKRVLCNVFPLTEEKLPLKCKLAIQM